MNIWPARRACLLLLLAWVSGSCVPSARAPAWDYLAMGVFAREQAGIGSVPGRYAATIEKDMGVRVALHNQDRMEPRDIAENLKTNESMRQLVREAEVIVFDFSLEWINRPEALYRAGMCKGPDNQDCLRAGVQEAKDVWSAIADLITELRDGKPVLIRVLIMGDWWLDWELEQMAPEKKAVLSQYYKEVVAFVEADAERRGIPIVRAFPEPYFHESQPPDEYFGGIGGIHYSEQGSAVLSDLLQDLGYEPVQLE